MIEDTRILAKIDRIMAWLRVHKGYDVTINFPDVYGCYLIIVRYETTTKLVCPGRHLEQQLDKVISYLECVDTLKVP